MTIKRPLAQFRLSQRCLLDIESLSDKDINGLLKLGHYYADHSPDPTIGQGKILMNLFFEPSTRTKLSFEVANRRLGFTAMNFDPSTSSMFKKGETLIDTIRTLNALSPDIAVIRHGTAESTQNLANLFECPVLNAGDGIHAHPTQALLDALTIERKKGTIEGLSILICGDILHSRVARSNLNLLKRKGAHLRIVAPPALLPDNISEFKADIFHNFEQSLEDVDVIMMLRIQKERMEERHIPEYEDYHRLYGLTETRLKKAKKDALIMHPGPVNWGVEIASDLVDHPQSVIDYQVRMGVAIRMAVLDVLTR